MNKELSPSRIYRSFLDHFVADGMTEIPYRHNEIHKAFYEVLNENTELASKWDLRKTINPYSGKLDEMMQLFQMCGVTSIDNLVDPQNIVVFDISRHANQSTEAEVEIAHKIHDSYLKLVV